MPNAVICLLLKRCCPDTHLTSIPLNALLKSQASLHLYRNLSSITWRACVFSNYLHAIHHLVMLPNKYGVISIMDKCEILWDVQISMDYVITKTRRINTSLEQNYEWLLLSITFECKLFMIFFFNWDRVEHSHHWFNGHILYILVC